MVCTQEVKPLPGEIIFILAEEIIWLENFG